MSSRAMQGGGAPNGRHRRGGQPRQQPAWKCWIPALATCAVIIFVSGAAVLYLNLQASRTGPDKLPATHQPASASSSGDSTAQLAGEASQAGPNHWQASDASAAADPNAPLVLPPEPPRLSDQAEHLTDAELHGGWKLTWEVGRAACGTMVPSYRICGTMALQAQACPHPSHHSLHAHLALCRTQMFDRATKHPNATVVSWSSPRVVLIRDFLAPNEIEHLVQQATGTVLGRMAAANGNFPVEAALAHLRHWLPCCCVFRCSCHTSLLPQGFALLWNPLLLPAGGFERSEVVTDGEKLDSARTSFGSWLSGHKRSAKVGGCRVWGRGSTPWCAA